jgi:conflict system pore-forming effector with SLATT domain
MSQPDFAMERIENQIDWYDKKSGYNQKMFKGMKTLTIVVSLLIPLFAAFAAYKGDIDGKNRSP